MKKLILILPFLFYQCASPTTEWILINKNHQATIYLPLGTSGPIQLAVQDLVSDVQKITGKKLSIVNDLSTLSGPVIIIANFSDPDQANLVKEMNADLDTLSGQWESYLVYQDQPFENIDEPLMMVGSDERGTLFAIYHFIEKYLQVDPFYFYTGMEPAKKDELVFSDIEIIQGEPDFKYRGWFINDEDLMTEFINGAGNRDIDYRYYDQVVHPDIIKEVFEAAVRSRYNLTIPASFIDIMNPPEKRLVEEAAKRGLFISQHHIEPVGVSAFSFFNYWEEKGEDYKFSFYSSRPQLEEVWEKYVAEWAKIPNVIWQIGLRGIADRPMWQADPDVPQSDADRGALISEAMQVQMDLIKKYDARENPPVTTTLWAEGAALNREGHLSFPENTIVVFADNSPGYVWQEDFYETEREPGRHYGVYYHHQLWGSGPHLAQAVPPAKTYEMFKLAYENNAHHYAIMNVSNVREFILGIESSAQMLDNIPLFDPDQYLQNWCEERFANASDLTYQAYQQFFDSYQIHSETKTPYTLDGQMRSYGLRGLNDIVKQLNDPEAFAAELQKRQKRSESDALGMNLSDAYPHRHMTSSEYLPAIEKQLAGLEKCFNLIPEVKSELSGDTLRFFENNYEAQVLILAGITEWLQNILEANIALQNGVETTLRQHLQEALSSLDKVKQGKTLASRGKWEHWYRGDKKMNMPSVEQRTEEVLKMVDNNL